MPNSLQAHLPVLSSAKPRFSLVLLVMLLYFLASKMTFAVSHSYPNVSLIWLPSGIATAALFRFGRPMMAVIFVAGLLMELSWSLKLHVAVPLALGNLLGPLLASWIMRRQRFNPRFARRRDVVGFTAAAMLGAALSSSAGILTVMALGRQPVSGSSWFSWWAGDAVGTLLIAPMLLSLSAHFPTALQRRTKELLTFLVVLCSVHWFVFLSPYNHLNMIFIVVGTLIWAAIRFDLTLVSSSTLASALFAAWAASQHQGPFSDDDSASLFTLWAYATTIALITLLIASLQSENRAARKQIHDAYQRIHKVASRLPGLVMQYRVRDQHTSSVPFASDTIRQMFEVAADEVRENARPLFQRIDRRDFETGKRRLYEAAAQLSAWQTEFRLHRRDGSIRWLYIDALPEPEPDGAMLWHCFVTDITDRKQADTELRIAACTFESQEGIFVTDPNWRILKVNQTFTRLTGYEATELTGCHPPILRNREQHEGFFQEIVDALHQHHFWHGELWSSRKNGDIYPQMITLTAIMDDNGEVSNYIGSFTDISQHKGYEAEIRNLAFYDSLTQLPNRRLLMDRLAHLISIHQRNSSHSAIFFIDLDNFKALNDTRGHDAGDLLLVETAKRLCECVRDSDTVARLGGDEFVVVLEELSDSKEEALQQAGKVAEKVRQVLSEPYQITDFEHHGSSSIGVCLFQGGDITVKDLFKRADTAMYEAKTAGRNAVRFFDPAMQAILVVRMLMESNLRAALANNQFQLHYQVQVNADGKLIGAEALLRWKHSDRGFISPADFIPVAEETGLILPIGKWVLETACVQLKKWEADPDTADLTLAVNVSAKQFQQHDFVDTLCDMVSRHQINPTRLKLELTESTILDNVDATTEKMHLLRKIGIAFSMDDFGTGYSSLAYLQRLPLNQLKIDQSFVRDLSEDENNATIVRAIISLGVNLGLNVIAEGVETKAQRAFLIAHNCYAFQGYLFSRPLPQEGFLAMIKEPPSNDA
ncbi:bifunctional diguanylate cyclase/phosphodiesterase [Undibacterium oligocarboniphilum]|uniref:EAL domain-containing protein n=1 Tax=Undibacterium oligocarboniphilum TaxID=666702 RepID=A0A850QJL2_9BURK|nr:EAL domain-containing protein [Undibacterium oligocarboniphilum]MBC3869316.1 EAL domain-containing protein [Undibacterium oligocarboniphilum]NVO77695.1 EAL domain-containing protein [Undibacterium oligocarboniphilum]